MNKNKCVNLCYELKYMWWYRISRESRNSQGEVKLVSSFNVHKYNLELLVRTVHPQDLSSVPLEFLEFLTERLCGGGPWKLRLKHVCKGEAKVGRL